MEQNLMLRKKQCLDNSAFTLVELVLVMAVLSILAVTAVALLNPAQRLAEARNLQRTSDVAQILGAIAQYVNEPGNSLSDFGSIAICPSTSVIGTSDINLGTQLVDAYIPSIPQDPSSGSAANTGYTVCRSNNNRVTIAAPNAEVGDNISITR